MLHMFAEAGAIAAGKTSSPEEDLRNLYVRESEHGRRRVTRKGLWIAVVAFLAYSLTDYLFIRDVAYYTVAGRLAVGVSALAILEVLIYVGARSGLIDTVAATAVSVAYLVWILTAQMSSAVE
ncbi:MAG: GGDEF-domain containing protein, partial [Cytophagaceae bacterium]